MEINKVDAFAYLAVILCVMTEYTSQKFWKSLVTKCNPLM